MARVGFTPSTFNSATADFTVGARYTDESTGYEYMFVKAQAALANGDVCTLGSNSATNTQVEVVPANTASALGTGTSERAVGVAVGTVTVNQYGFIMTRGIHSAVKDAANGVTAGSYVMPHATTDGNAANVTVGTNDALAFGYALAAGSGGVVKVWVNC